MKFWRERLDQTTYWAIVVMSAILTWSFSSRNNPHYVVLLGAAAVTAFLVIGPVATVGTTSGADASNAQKNVFAYGLDPPPVSSIRRGAKLSQDYRRPTIKISIEEAIAHRLRRIYLVLYTILLGAWVIRVTSFASRSWPESAAIGEIPGLLVFAMVAACYLLAVFVTVRPRTWEAEDGTPRGEIGPYRPGRSDDTSREQSRERAPHTCYTALSRIPCGFIPFLAYRTVMGRRETERRLLRTRIGSGPRAATAGVPGPLPKRAARRSTASSSPTDGSEGRPPGARSTSSISRTSHGSTVHVLTVMDTVLYSPFQMEGDVVDALEQGGRPNRARDAADRAEGRERRGHRGRERRTVSRDYRLRSVARYRPHRHAGRTAVGASSGSCW